ncbi:MAG: PAS domain S-box protein [Burkholderiales bacterium]|nr:PAS domain S-box protein [Burkholderiales bacterium]
MPEQSLYRQLFEAAPDAILVVDASGRIRMNNPEAERILEAGPGELHGLSVERLVPLKDRRHHVQLRQGFHAEPKRRPMGVGMALKAVKLTGREFPVEIALASTRGSSGDEVIVVLRDVSERLAARRTERELVRANTLARISQLAVRERQFETVGAQATQLSPQPLGADAVLLFRRNANGGQLECIQAAGPEAAALQAAVIPNAHAMLAGQVLASGAPVLVGDVTTAGMSICPSLTDAGMRSLVLAPIGDRELVSGLLIAGSKTPHHFTTDDVAFVEAIANIASNALQRTVAEEKLLLSQRLESLGQLTGGVAHDFNNLLTVISGNLQILEDMAIADPFAQRAIASAHRATRRGAELTGKLLAFSRRQTLHPAPIHIPELLTAFRDLLARTLGANIDIRVVTEDNLPLVLADSGQLDTALLNLAVNARDAMPEGGHLVIEATQVLLDRDTTSTLDDVRPGHYVRLSVSDTGTGMTRETMTRAFEPFFTTKAVGKGSGLGLSMVYGFAKQSAGHVSVYSELGVGTTINLFLPATAHVRREGATSHKVAAPIIGTESVLVVEDDPDVLAVAKRFLQSLGYRVFTAKSKRGATERLRANPEISVLFTDVILHGNETGPKIAAALCKIRPDLRVLYASGYARSALPLTLGLERDIAFLRKPYSRDQLGQAIRQLFAAVG